MTDVPELVKQDVVEATRRGCQHGHRGENDGDEDGDGGAVVRAKRSRAAANNDDDDNVDDNDNDNDAVIENVTTTTTTTTTVDGASMTAVQASDVAMSAEHALPLLAPERLMKLVKTLISVVVVDRCLFEEK